MTQSTKRRVAAKNTHASTGGYATPDMVCHEGIRAGNGCTLCRRSGLRDGKNGTEPYSSPFQPFQRQRLTGTSRSLGSEGKDTRGGQRNPDAARGTEPGAKTEVKLDALNFEAIPFSVRFYLRQCDVLFLLWCFYFWLAYHLNYEIM